jgi:hypothetical protein
MSLKEQIGSLANYEGMAVLLLTVGYIALVFMLCIMWSTESGAVITGFCIFAQRALDRFFDQFKRQSGDSGGFMDDNKRNPSDPGKP